MSCFSQPVKSASSTRIFARASSAGRQLLVYSVNISARQELAMILPLPVPPGTPADAVHFISLAGYANFFEELAHGFNRNSSLRLPAVVTESAEYLRVPELGTFEPMYVPRLADFQQLDRRFRLPNEVWTQLPAYRDYGFAVFKMKAPPLPKLSQRLGHPPAQTMLPMAIEFPRRNPQELFFPTVHVNDGMIHPKADFDHTLYCQLDYEPPASTFDRPSAESPTRPTEPGFPSEIGTTLNRLVAIPMLNPLATASSRRYLPWHWEASNRSVERLVDMSRTAGVLVGGRPCYRKLLGGSLKNHDIIIGPRAS